MNSKKLTIMEVSKLTDTQLLQLIQEALNESISRGGTVASVAIEEKEAAQIKAEAFAKAAAGAKEQKKRRLEEQARREAESSFSAIQDQKEADKIKSLWQMQKAIPMALDQWGLKEEWQLNVWSRGADRRVYLDGESSFDRGCYADTWKICLYVSGNDQNPPESLSVAGKNKFGPSHPLKDDREEDLEKLKQFLLLVSQHWKSLKVSRSEILKFSGDSNEKHLAAYRRVLLPDR